MKKEKLNKLIQKKYEDFEAEKLRQKKSGKISVQNICFNVERDGVVVSGIGKYIDTGIRQIELIIEFKKNEFTTKKQIYKGIKKELKKLYNDNF